MREKIVFFWFSFPNFFDFWAKIFQTFGQKTSRKCENYLLRVHRNNLWLYIFLKSFEPFWIFYRNLWHGSQNSIYVSRESKNFGRNSFLIFLFRIFSDFERKFFSDFRPKSSWSFQNYLLRVQRNSLWLEIFFLKFWIVSDFLQKPLAWFSKVYLRVQSKKCGQK